MRATPEKRAFARKLRKNATEAERALWQRIRRRQLGFKFRRQVPIRGYIADFYCAKARLIVEVDGLIHESRRDYDARRTTHLTRAGFTVIRFSNDQVMMEVERVAQSICAAAHKQLQSYPGLDRPAAGN